MVLQPLENEAKRQAFAETLRQKKEEKSSGGFWHESYAKDHKREMKPLRQKKENRSKEKRMQEIFHTKNAYGEISLGMNQKGETMLAAAREHNYNGPTVEHNETQLDELHSYKWRGKAGNRMTNVKKPVESAFALNSTHQHDGENRHRGDTLLLQSQQFAAQSGQHAALSLLPQKSIQAGQTKSKSAREMKLAHQLELALRMGEKTVKKNGEENSTLQKLMNKLEKQQKDDNETEILPRIKKGEDDEEPEESIF